LGQEETGANEAEGCYRIQSAENPLRWLFDGFGVQFVPGALIAPLDNQRFFVGTSFTVTSLQLLCCCEHPAKHAFDRDASQSPTPKFLPPALLSRQVCWHLAKSGSHATRPRAMAALADAENSKTSVKNAQEAAARTRNLRIVCS
jgi:hypothetical protein